MDSKKDEILTTLTEIEFHPVFDEKISLAKCETIPLEQFAVLGMAFLPFVEALKQVKTVGGTKKIYETVIPHGLKLAKVEGENAFLGTLVKDKIGIVQQARFKEIKSIGVNPVMLCVAAALMTVTKKLNDIKNAQDEIIAFLEQKEEAKLKGNLNILTDILNQYKYNLGNDAYKNNKHIQIQEIKRDAEQSVIFYRKQIEQILTKKKFFHADRAVGEKIKKIENYYKDYQLALYLYTYSAFLETVLLENFESGYLASVRGKIEQYAQDYLDLYSKAFGEIEGYAKTSMENRAIKALSGLSSGAGGLAEKIPLIKSLKLGADLKNTGKRLETFGDKKTEKTMEKVFEGSVDFITPFVERINLVDKLYNEEVELLTDGENLYIKH